MATHIPEGASIRVVVDVTDATSAAVESDPETNLLVPTWVGLRDRADTEAKKRADCDRAVARARGRLAVCDAKWDETVAAFARAVVDAAGGRRDQATYLRFFGKATPSQTQKFGVGREIESGRQLLVELGRNPSEPLAQTWVPRLKEATDALEAASEERKQTVNALAPQQVSVVLLIDDINRELDRLEGDLKKLFPLAPARVSAYLAATRRPTPAEAAAPAPAIPPVAAPAPS